ncbi:M20/M25/M40 family metallo-hydrolase [bacterium]|nr:M20/M25/M40 family metallo-hydrolase [bacterium]
MDLLELTRRLIAIDSVTGNEAGLVRFLKDFLESAGMAVTLQPIDGGRSNLFAVFEEPSVVLSTHLDTVPPFIGPSENDRRIYGRGACDAKGAMAAMVQAALTLAREGVRDAGLLFVAGEEKGSDGARAANALPNRCRFLINGEPTENRLALGSKGALRFRLTAVGRPAHSAYPERGESAIEKLLIGLNRLRGMPLLTHGVLGPESLNIGTLAGGTAANIIPDRANAEVMMRCVGPASETERRVRQAVGAGVGMETLFDCDPVFLEAVDGFETTVVSFTTDIPLLNRWGRPLLLGPGSILDAHAPDESVAIADLEESVDLYRRLVRRLRESGEIRP